MKFLNLFLLVAMILNEIITISQNSNLNKNYKVIDSIFNQIKIS